jgi:DNA-binding protein HU-beta
MTKEELVEKMANDAVISKAAAGKTLDSFIDGITKALKKKDGKVTLVGFGTFSKFRRKARKRRHPRRLFLSFILERKYTLCHNAFTSLMIVLIW